MTTAFLSTSFGSAYTALTIDETNKIPRILLQWSEYKARGNLTELKRIRAEIARQLEWNEERIKSTNGAVLQPPKSLMASGHYLTVAEWSDDQFNWDYLVFWQKIAWVENPTALGGTYGPDGDCTRLIAINFNGAEWGEALTHCHTNDVIMGNTEIYAYAKKGTATGLQMWPTPGTWTNYLIAQVALDPDDMWDWHFVGYQQVFSDSITAYDLGSTYWYSAYNHVSISTMCPGNWYPVERNDVEVDFAYTVD